MRPPNTSGSFLVRDSESSPGVYSLSVRDSETVIHYRIHKSDSGAFFVVPCVTFESIPDLVVYYSKQKDSLCDNLVRPCSTVEDEEPQNVGSPEDEDLEINKESIRLITKLGAGRFGEVWEGIWNDCTPVAVKMFNGSVTGVKELRKAAALMKKLDHPKLIQFYGVSTKEEPIYIITEMMKHGSLLEYLKKNNHYSLKLPQLVDIGVQVASGMAYLEENDYIHRDLSAKNVFVTVNSICKVGGLSVVESSCETHSRGMSPVKWTAPEALMHSNFSIKSDVWSFGILLYEIITFGSAPYPEMNNGQVIQEVQGGYRMPCPANCPGQLYEVMMDCWKDDTASRPSFESLLYRLENFFADPEQTQLYPDKVYNSM